jgi:hypothetical protein
MSGNLREAGCLRTLDHTSINRTVAVRRSWVERSPDYYSSNRAITDDMVQNLHAMCDVLTNTQHQHKLIVESNYIRVYTNNCQLFNEITQAVPALHYVNHTQAVIDRPRNSIKLKESTYTHRTYFRSARMSDQQKRSISQFLRNQDTIKLSPGLKNWALYSEWRSGTESYYFVDHNDTAWMTMLSLIYPGLIKNTIQIVKA